MYEGPGIYLHYKGTQYDVLGVAVYESSLGPCVIYKPIDPEKQAQLAKLGGAEFWVRPLNDFNGAIRLNKKSQNRVVPRFGLLRRRSGSV